MTAVLVELKLPPTESDEPEFVEDLDVLVESSKCSCNAGDDNPRPVLTPMGGAGVSVPRRPPRGSSLPVMRLRADWLSRVLTVPYVPILGPAHPDQFTAEMFTDVFADILTASRTGTALPFDKDRRWSPRKTDTVLVDEIVHRPDHTIIPTLSGAAVGRSRPSTTAMLPISTPSGSHPALLHDLRRRQRPSRLVRHRRDRGRGVHASTAQGVHPRPA